MIRMMRDVASADGDPSAKQSEYIGKVQSLFVPPVKGDGTWS